jgi:hypothetical protein
MVSDGDLPEWDREALRRELDSACEQYKPEAVNMFVIRACPASSPSCQLRAGLVGVIFSAMISRFHRRCCSRLEVS